MFRTFRTFIVFLAAPVLVLLLAAARVPAQSVVVYARPTYCSTPVVAYYAPSAVSYYPVYYYAAPTACCDASPTACCPAPTGNAAPTACCPAGTVTHDGAPTATVNHDVAPTACCPAPTVSYYAAPTVSYYGAATAYYAPARAITTYYRYGLFGRRVATTTYYYP